MVAALDPLRKAEPPENRAKVVESDAGIRRAPQYSHQNRLAHTSLCAQGQIPVFQLSATSRAPALPRVGDVNEALARRTLPVA
jgi:hypothetical protein